MPEALSTPESEGQRLWVEFASQIDAVEPLLKHAEADEFGRHVAKGTWSAPDGLRSLRITKFDDGVMPHAIQISVTKLDTEAGLRDRKTFYAEQWPEKEWELRTESDTNEIGHSRMLETPVEELYEADDFAEETGLNRGDIFELQECLDVLKSLATLPRADDSE